jgi:hypothetical protein
MTHLPESSPLPASFDEILIWPPPSVLLHSRHRLACRGGAAPVRYPNRRKKTRVAQCGILLFLRRFAETQAVGSPPSADSPVDARRGGIAGCRVEARTASPFG